MSLNDSINVNTALNVECKVNLRRPYFADGKLIKMDIKQDGKSSMFTLDPEQASWLANALLELSEYAKNK